MRFKIVLNFDDIFPDEKKLSAIEYLKKIPKELLLKTIGFCNTYPLPNYDNFFSNPEVAREIYYRIQRFKRNSTEKEDLEIITPYSYLKLSEIVLSNLEHFDEDGDQNEDFELSLFKAFLVLNNRFSEFNHDFSKEQGLDSFVNFIILQGFQLYEISTFENDKNELAKLIYSTIYKVENLLSFLSHKKLVIVKEKFIKSFDMENEQDFLYHMKYLLAMLFIVKYTNQYIFTDENFDSFSLIKNISINKITEDEDFTELKKTPIYFLDENRFSIVNFFFAVDLFYRSAKFRLKEIFIEEKLELGDFFTFYTTEFSEKFLMKNLLNNIFSKKYFIKKIEFNPEKKNEPDFYINYNNTLLLFENKDVLIGKTIKSSTDVSNIDLFLKEKFYQSSKKGVGIKQIINSIQSIYKQNFEFDKQINYDKKIEIFPILIVHDRILQSVGINYRLNNWFREELTKHNIISNEKFKIYSLTVLDIDTLILWNNNVKDNFSLFKNLLINHTKNLDEKARKTYTDSKYFGDYLQRILRPISSRETPFFIPKDDFTKQFLNLVKK